MSTEITTGFSEEFSSNVNLLSQQLDTRLRGSVTVESKTGKSAQMINQVGIQAAQKRTTRHSDTPILNTPHDSRWVFPVDYEWGDLIDKQDDVGVRSIASFEGPYARTAASALNRAIDSEIMSAFFSDTTKTGEDAGTTTSWSAFVSANAGHQIAHGSGGLTTTKIRQGLKALRAANVDLTMEPVFMAITSEQIEDLQSDSNYIDYDFTAIRAFDAPAGEIKPFLGVNFIHYEDVTYSSSTWSCPMWVPSGMGLGVFDDIKGRIEDRADKSFATQVYACGTFGATRLEEKKIVEIQCQ